MKRYLRVLYRIFLVLAYVAFIVQILNSNIPQAFKISIAIVFGCDAAIAAISAGLVLGGYQ